MLPAFLGVESSSTTSILILVLLRTGDSVTELCCRTIENSLRRFVRTCICSLSFYGLLVWANSEDLCLFVNDRGQNDDNIFEHISEESSLCFEL